MNKHLLVKLTSVGKSINTFKTMHIFKCKFDKTTKVLTFVFCGARVCLLITIVVVLRSLVPPGDFGGTISTGLFDLLTNDSAALTTSNT